MRAGRAMASPTVCGCRPDSAAAAVLGRHPSSSATRRIRARVSAETPGRLCTASDTALVDTPARAATSRMVAGAGGVLAALPVAALPVTGTAPVRSPLRR